MAELQSERVQHRLVEDTENTGVVSNKIYGQQNIQEDVVCARPIRYSWIYSRGPEICDVRLFWSSYFKNLSRYC